MENKLECRGKAFRCRQKKKKKKTLPRLKQTERLIPLQRLPVGMQTVLRHYTGTRCIFPIAWNVAQCVLLPHPLALARHLNELIRLFVLHLHRLLALPPAEHRTKLTGL